MNWKEVLVFPADTTLSPEAEVGPPPVPSPSHTYTHSLPSFSYFLSPLSFCLSPLSLCLSPLFSFKSFTLFHSPLSLSLSLSLLLSFSLSVTRSHDMNQDLPTARNW